MIQIRSFTILLFALNVLLRDSVALDNLTSVDDFFQIWAPVRRLEFMHNFNDFLNDDGYTPSISNQTTRLRSTLEDHSLSTYCTSTRGTCTPQNVVQSAFPRSVHVAEVVSLALVSNCLHLRLIVLDAITEDRHSCAHRSISFQTYCHRVCLITRVLKLDILITSAIVKTHAH